MARGKGRNEGRVGKGPGRERKREIREGEEEIREERRRSGRERRRSGRRGDQGGEGNENVHRQHIFSHVTEDGVSLLPQALWSHVVQEVLPL